VTDPSQPSPPSKPLRADARRNRERVLQIARSALADDGLAISFDEIARRAGFGVGTVYRHFPTKQDLFEAVLSDRIRQLIAGAHALADADDPAAAFLGYFAAVVEQASVNQALCDALDNSAAAAFKTDSALEQEFAQALGHLLDRAQRTGAVQAELDVGDVIDLLIGSVTTERRARTRDRPGRLTSTICQGMLIAPGQA
jgi:AcrR family transcriptional regulator